MESSSQLIGKRRKLSMMDDQKITEDEAIRLMRDMNISKRQYNALLKLMESKDMKTFFPSQNKILLRETQILPTDKIAVTQFSAKIDTEFAILSTLKALLMREKASFDKIIEQGSAINIEFCIKLGI